MVNIGKDYTFRGRGEKPEARVVNLVDGYSCSEDTFIYSMNWKDAMYF